MGANDTALIKQAETLLAATYMRQMMMTTLETFITTANETNLLPEVKDTFSQIAQFLYQQWPDLEPFGFYPVFSKTTST